MKDPDFFNRLYRGFEAENLIAGKLFGAGLEAFKLPADFGFDLLVSNQMAKSLGSRCDANRVAEFPYVVQVKSRRISFRDLKPNNGRMEAWVDIRITVDEYVLLSKEQQSYLVMVLFLPEEQGVLSEKHVILWFKGTQLPALRDATYLGPLVSDDGRRFYEISVVVRLIRKAQTKDLLQRLLDDEKISQEAFKILGAKLPLEYMQGKSVEYVSLARRSFGKDEGAHTNRRVVYKVDDCQTDILQIGCAVSERGVVADRTSRPPWTLLTDLWPD